MSSQDATQLNRMNDYQVLHSRQQQGQGHGQDQLTRNSARSTAAQGEVRLQQSRTPNQSTHANATLSKEEREFNLLISQLSGAQLPARIQPLRMSTRELLDDFIRSLPPRGLYGPFPTDLFDQENSRKWYHYYCTIHKAHHKAGEKMIFEGMCRIWTHKAPLATILPMQSVGGGPFWAYSVAATAVMGSDGREERVQVLMKVPLNAEPIWVDVVRCLQGANYQVRMVLISSN